MSNKNSKIYIGFLGYNDLTARYLNDFLPGLKEQTYKDYQLVMVENSDPDNDKNTQCLKKYFPGARTINPGYNTGFAAGFNLVIREAIQAGAKYFLAINPDMILEPDVVEKLYKFLEQHPEAGAVVPKIFRWDFKAGRKTDRIDSCGLFITREHRFSDRLQGERDDGSESRPYEVFGFSGAAVMLRLKALEDVAFVDENGRIEYFDELMFMYKEDVDLSYRFRLAGWSTYVVPDAKVFHDRTAAPIGESSLKIAFNRRNKSRQLKSWSYLNHWILLLKLRKLTYSPGITAGTYWYQLKSLVFILLFEQYLLKEFMNLYRLLPRIRQRREKLKIRSKISEIERFMK